jgi:hypothetical protein
MHQLNILHRLPRGSLSKDLADQIYEIGMQGKVAIVTDKPITLLASTRKQWMRRIRRAERDRSSTLNKLKVAELTQRMAWMRSLRFTATRPTDLLEADVTFATAEDFVRVPPICRTIYVTYIFDKEKLHMLTSWMPRGGLVVVYAQR